jgi:lysophospholipase L1-like esterase
MSDITQTRYPKASVNYLQKKLISGLGVIQDYNNEDYYITDYVDVSSYDKIWVDCACTYTSCAACFYYDDYSLCQIAIKNETSSGNSWNARNNAELSVPAGAKYVVLSGTNVGRNHLPVVRYKNGVIISKPWNGKKWCCVGDSLTEFNSRTSKNYFEYVSEEMGIECVNMGVSGSGYKHKSDENKAFYQRISNVPVDSDVVTIFGSGNDLNYVPSNIGTAADVGTTTLAGCINTTIDNLYAVLPAVHLGIVAPTPWKSSNPYGADTRMTQYVALLKEICERRSIAFLDLYHCSNLRPWDDDFLPIAYSKDDGGGVHPDEIGHKLIANRFKVFIESIM